MEKDKDVINALFTVSTSDDKFSRSGAAGISNKEKEPIATPDTPFFIGSITKLFTAVVITPNVRKDLHKDHD